MILTNWQISNEFAGNDERIEDWKILIKDIIENYWKKCIISKTNCVVGADTNFLQNFYCET